MYGQTDRNITAKSEQKVNLNVDKRTEKEAKVLLKGSSLVYLPMGLYDEQLAGE